MTAPIQPLAVGVTVIVAVVEVVPAFVALNDGIFPFPLAPNPIEVVLFDQSKVVAAVVLVKLTAVVGEPLHNVSFGIGSAIGEGLTVIVNTSGVPTHPLIVGVTVISPEIGA